VATSFFCTAAWYSVSRPATTLLVSLPDVKYAPFTAIVTSKARASAPDIDVFRSILLSAPPSFEFLSQLRYQATRRMSFFVRTLGGAEDEINPRVPVFSAVRRSDSYFAHTATRPLPRPANQRLFISRVFSPEQNHFVGLHFSLDHQELPTIGYPALVPDS